MKGRALRRALATNAVDRIAGDVPLITDTTEWITPEIAREYMKRNTSNRPINWRLVEDYSKAMAEGRWQFHGQGIMFDANGNLLTGQKRLLALEFSGLDGIWMRVSRGNPVASARFLDRGVGQSARDLAARGTGRKHSPAEASIARAICAGNGNLKPSIDELSATIECNAEGSRLALAAISGTRKTKSVLMVLAAVVNATDEAAISEVALEVDRLATRLDAALAPQTVAQCWNRGAAFALAMKAAAEIVAEAKR